GHRDARDPAVALRQTVAGGVTVGDRGYRGPEGASSRADAAEMVLISRARAPEHQVLLSWLTDKTRLVNERASWRTSQAKVAWTAPPKHGRVPGLVLHSTASWQTPASRRGGKSGPGTSADPPRAV